MEVNSENDKDRVKEKEIILKEESENLTKSEDWTKVVEKDFPQQAQSEEIKQEEVVPIPVKIISEEGGQLDLEQKQKEFFEHYDLMIKKIKETHDLWAPPPGKLMKAWLWFQKHAFTSVLILVLGITIGIGINKIMCHNDMMKAINIQRFEFKGDLFEIQPSSIKKYYVDGEKSIGSLIPSAEKKADANEEIPESIKTKRSR